jgi:hypothetical protein
LVVQHVEIRPHGHDVVHQHGVVVFRIFDVLERQFGFRRPLRRAEHLRFVDGILPEDVRDDVHRFAAVEAEVERDDVIALFVGELFAEVDPTLRFVVLRVRMQHDHAGVVLLLRGVGLVVHAAKLHAVVRFDLNVFGLLSPAGGRDGGEHDSHENKTHNFTEREEVPIQRDGILPRWPNRFKKPQ